MNILSSVGKAVLYTCGWAGLFLACRAGAWFLAVPAWWSVPASIGIGLLAVGAGRLRAFLKREEEDRQALSRRDPKVSARFRQAWKRGRPYLDRGILPPSPERPWYLCLTLPGNMTGNLLELGDAVTSDTAGYDDEFTWRKGPSAAWLDFPGGMPDDDRWRAFASVLGAIPHFRPPSGVVVRVDAVRLIANTHATVHDDAVAMRRKLEQLQNACRSRIPFYVVVDNLDRLYGLRSVISRIDAASLAKPLGRVRTDGGKECAEFVAACLDDCLGTLGAFDPEAGPAALQAPEEIRRLETPLMALCAQLSKNAATGPCLRGLFLAAASPGGEGTPPLLSRLPTFQAMDETLPVQPWFLRNLLRDAIPADAEASRRDIGGRRRYPAAAMGLLAGSVALCLFMTFSFVESRGVLLSARGRAGAPASPENLQHYLELATVTRLRNNGWRLPRFGMNEPEALEEVLRQRYTDSYFDLKTIPSIEHVQDAAIEAADSRDPMAIGNALLLLTVTRDGIGRNLRPARERERHTRFLHTLVETLGLADTRDMEQLETYFTWAGRQDWMPETHAALVDFEKYIADNAGGGDFSWLPEWINRLPGLRGLDTGRVWEMAPERRPEGGLIGPAWTTEGYDIASRFLAAIAYDVEDKTTWAKKREAALARYRTKALEYWRQAAATLWDGFQTRIPDAKLHELYRDAVRGDDPAARFLLLVRHHLLPMFGGVEDAAEPDVRWIRLHDELFPVENEAESKPAGLGRLAEKLADTLRDFSTEEGLDNLTRQLAAGGGTVPARMTEDVSRWRNALRQAGFSGENPEQNLDAVRAQFQAWNNPGQLNFSGRHAALQDAAEPAGSIHEFLRETSGSAAWDGLSPLATLDYLRYLASRQAAITLDALWRERVYQPAQLTAGGEAERMTRLTAPGGTLERFLTGTASGFWRWDGSRLVNTEWNKIEFMLDRSFLDFCAATLREGKTPGTEKLDMPLSIDAVHVDREAKERPTELRLTFTSGGKRQTVPFRNYRMKDLLSWYFDDDVSAEIAVVFPSLTATVRYSGREPVGVLIDALAAGEVVLPRDLFPEARAALGRMGIGRIVVRAKLENTDAIVRHAARPPLTIPESIVTPCLAPEPKPGPTPAYGPFTSTKR